MNSKKNNPAYLSNERLRILFTKGIIPFPGETTSALLKRTDYLEELSLNPATFFSKIPHSSFFFLTDKLPWFLGFYKPRPLPFWIAALTWIVPTLNGFSVPCLQLPSSSSFLLPSRKEIIDHESVHARRANFNEPRFEELLAYRTSRSRFRRLIGPLFQSTFESSLLLFSLLISLFFAIFSSALVPALCSSAYLFFLGGRLFFRQKTLARCLKALSSSYKNCDQLLTHLTDKEITLIAKKGSVIRKKSCLRWRQINALYSLSR